MRRPNLQLGDPGEYLRRTSAVPVRCPADDLGTSDSAQFP